MNRQILEQEGFSGFVTVGQLKKNIDIVPEEQGVYAVLYTKETEPDFLQRGTGGFFKGEDPNVPLSELKANWVEGADIVYVGKAGGEGSKATLRSRLSQYMKFGSGKPVGHRGGRYIWQLADADDLVICWKVLSTDPREYERQMIIDFKTAHDGIRPFANLLD